MDILFRKSLLEIFTDIKNAFKERNFSKLLDYFILLLFCSTALFIVVYKISINSEKLLFGTNMLVLSDRIKGALPQLMLYVLIVVSVFKWILSIRKGNPQITEKEENITDSVTFHLGKTTYSIKKDTFYTLGLIFIIFIFIAAKIHYWDIPFTHNHPLKYNTYVDPALSMFKNNDPFLYQLKYMNEPIRGSLGLGSSFGGLPILEWTLFIAYKIFWNVLSVESITRLVMSIWGSIALISIYNFLKKAFNKSIGLLSVFLLSVNSIFNLSFFVTVYDAITFSLTFFSFSLLIDSVKKNNIQKLAFSALLLGMGASIKENILIWGFPFIFLYLFLNYRKEIKEFYSKSFLYIITLFLPYIIVRTTINYFPMKEPKYFILFFVFTAILFVFVNKIENIYNFIQRIIKPVVDYINKHKKILWLVPVLVVLMIKAVYSTTISEEFLTDWTLLFNIDLYYRLLNVQIIPYTGVIPFCIFLFSIFFFIFYNKNKHFDIVMFSLFSGSMFYLITASKVLFFHSYYWLFILASITILISWGIYFMINSFYRGSTRFLYITLFIVTLFLHLMPFVESKLNRQYSDILDVVEYINSENIEEGTSFFDQANTSYLTIKTDLYKISNTDAFATRKFKDSVAEIGFIESMKKYKILYVITSSSMDYSAFAEAFLSEDSEPTNVDRTSSILFTLYGTQTADPKHNIKNKVLEENHIDDQFKLIKNFGQFKVYKLTEACFKTVIE